MLTITPEASHAIRGVLDTQNAPDGSMLRISQQAEEAAPTGQALVVSLAESPPPDDQIIEGDEVAICVEPSAAEMLADKELDAKVVGGQINFSIGEQGGVSE